MNKDMVAAVYDPAEYKLVPLKDLGKWVDALVEDGYGNQPTALIKTVVGFAPNVSTNASLFVYPFTADSDNVMEATEKVLFELLAKRKTDDTMVELPLETKGPYTRQFDEIFNTILGPVAKATPTGEMPAIPPRPAPRESDFAKGLSEAIDKFNAALARSEFAPRESGLSPAFAAPYGGDAWSGQVGGDHYKNLAIQPMAYSLANGLDGGQHTTIKYVTRFKTKGGKADLEKAKHTIDLLIAHYYKSDAA